MNDIGVKIKEARIKSKLSLKELSDKTKIRLFVIESIEKGDYSVMPEVYIKSFIKTLCTFLKIQYEDLPNTEKPVKNKKKKFDDDRIESQIIAPTSQVSVEKPYLPEISTKTETSHFGELFKKKNINKEKRYLIINYIVYAVLFLAVASAIYFGFTSLNPSSTRIENSEVTGSSDTVSLESESNSLFSYFEKSDSLRLTAKAHDTVWIRVMSDGKSLNESLLKPGMEESWTAMEYFIVDLGNVGGANIYRNDEKLPVFGKMGSVVKNIKITKTEVLNIYSARNDSIRAARRKAETDSKLPPKMIEQSTIQTIPEFSLPKRDTLRF